MEWLKDKKNLPIVMALTVTLFALAGGVIAWELGLFSGSSTPVASAPAMPTGAPGGMPPGTVPPGSMPPGSMAPRGPGGPPGMQGVPTGVPTGIPRGVAGAPAITVVKKPVNTNPAVGPDPFKIPNGAEKAAKIAARLAGPKLPLRDAIGPLNLFQIRPPAPPPVPVLPDVGNGGGGNTTVGPDPAARYRLSGIINGTDGINAIIEVDGQSQSVKPGDSLSDGAKVTNIQATSVTLRTTGGAAITLQLSAGTPDQGNAQSPNNFNGQGPFQPGFPQQGQNN